MSFLPFFKNNFIKHSSNSRKGFPGGLNLAHHPAEPPPEVIRRMPMPEELHLQLNQRSHWLTPLVSTGDKVVRGQPLTLTHESGQSLIASADGTISHIDHTIVIKTTAPSDHAATTRHKNTVPGEITDWQSLSALLIKGGITGLGGAAFSSGKKIAATGKNHLSTLVINACECEPLLSCDQALIRHHADDIAMGVQVLLRALKPEQCLIGLEEAMQTEYHALEQSLRNLSETNPSLPCTPRLQKVASVFPAGSERQLIRSLTGTNIPGDSRPSAYGILCFNVATVYAIKRLVLEGLPPVSRVVSVTGTAVDEPCNVLTPIGTTVHDLAAFVAPELMDKHFAELEIKQGGAMTGQILTAKNPAVTAATNCLQLNHKKATVPATECIRCGYCTEVCPESLIPQQLLWYVNAENYEAAEKFKLQNCIECGCCDYVCPSSIPLATIFKNGKHERKERYRLDQLAKQAQEKTVKRSKRLAKRIKEREERLAERKKQLQYKQSDLPDKNAINDVLERARRRKKPK